MKKFFWIIIAVCALYACNPQYFIKGEIDAPKGTKIVLKKVTDSIPVEIDSCFVKRGKFKMKGTVEYPEYCILYAGDNGPLFLFVENTEMQIVIDKENIQKSKVTGSTENELFVTFNNKIAEFEDCFSKLNNEYLAMLNPKEPEPEAETNFDAELEIITDAKQEPEPDVDVVDENVDVEEEIELEIIAEVDTIPKNKEYYITQLDSLKKQRIDYMKQFVAENPKTMVSIYVLSNYLSNYLTIDEVEMYIGNFFDINVNPSAICTVLEKIGEQTNFLKQLQTIIAKAKNEKLSEVGQPFIEVKMPDNKGNEISISDFVGKDNYILLDFWASWCKPCRSANPDLVKLYKKYKEKGFEIIGISLDREKSEWTKAIRVDTLNWIQMSDLKYWQSAGAVLYAVNSIPHTVLLDKDGTILAKGLKPDELDAKLKELISD